MRKVKPIFVSYLFNQCLTTDNCTCFCKEPLYTKPARRQGNVRKELSLLTGESLRNFFCFKIFVTANDQELRSRLLSFAVKTRIDTLTKCLSLHVSFSAPAKIEGKIQNYNVFLVSVLFLWLYAGSENEGAIAEL